MSGRCYIPSQILIKFFDEGKSVEVFLDEKPVPGYISGVTVYFKEGVSPTVQVLLGNVDSDSYGSEAPSSIKEIIQENPDTLPPSSSGITPMGNRLDFDPGHFEILRGYFANRDKQFLEKVTGTFSKTITISTDPLYVVGEQSVNELIHSLATEEIAIVDSNEGAELKIASPPVFILDDDGYGHVEETIAVYE